MKIKTPKELETNVFKKKNQPTQYDVQSFEQFPLRQANKRRINTTLKMVTCRHE